MNHWLAYQLSRDNGFEAKQLSMFTMMLMLMMLMMMRQEQLPTFFWSETAMAISTVNYKRVDPVGFYAAVCHRL